MIDADMISNDFFEVLSKSGWKPSRIVDTTAWIELLKNEGYKPNPVALSVLESLGGMTILLPSTPDYQYHIKFDPLYAEGEYEYAKDWFDIIRVNLFPIGHLRGCPIVWIGDDEKVYYGHEFGLYRMGNSFSSAMDWCISTNGPELERCAD